MDVVELVFAIIGVIAIPILLAVGTFFYWIIHFLRHGDG